ncbi:MAG: site-specific integrase [Planctomycetes bacterium]|nr:site-specific integrase [Planctomycetota bacterium]
MASLEQRGDSYRIVFRHAGQKFTRSLKTSDAKQAGAMLSRLEDNLRRVELGSLSAPLGCDVCTFLLSDGRLDQRPRPKHLIRTLGKLLDEYQARLPENSVEPTTLHCLKIHIGHFKRVLKASCPLDSLSLATLQRYVDTRSKATGLRGKPLSASTIKKEIATLTTVWTWAQQHEHVDRPLPKKGLRYPKTDERPAFQTIAEVERKIELGGLSEAEIADLWDAVYLTLPEIDELLEHVRAHAMHPFLYPMFAFAAHTGARRSEMRRSQIHDLDLDARRAIIRERKRVRGRHSTRLVPLSPFLMDVLRQWLAKHPGSVYTFPIEQVVPKSRKRRPSPQALTCEEAGHHFQQALLGSKWEKLRGWHVFRHSFCSNCACAGVDQRMINAWVGHQTEDMVRRYRHLIPDQQQDEIGRVFSGGPRPRFGVVAEEPEDKTAASA